MTIDVEEVLSEHAALRTDAVGDGALAAAKRTLLDTVACMVAGLRSPECQALRDLAERRGGAAESTIVGSERRVPASAAATCNAAQAHWYEWDDLHDGAIIHASAVIWPALLATAEAAGMDTAAAGSEVLAAAVVAYDIAAGIGNAVTPHAHFGWYATAPGGAVGAAAGAARLRALPTRGIRAAMGLAATSAGLNRQPLLDKVNGKNALCAQTVNGALFAVELAQAGIIGAQRFLTGDYGLVAMMAGGRGTAPVALADLGVRFAVEAMSAKPYPCCRATHQAIDLALQLRARRPDLAQSATAIRVRVPQPTFDMCGAPFAPGANPRVSAQFSIPYTVAVALLQGRVGLADFDAENVVANAPVHALAARVSVESFPLAPGQGQYDLPLTVTCTTRGGDTIALSTPLVKGSPEHPMSADDHRRKLLDCADGFLSRTAADDLQNAVDALDRDGLAPVMTLLRNARATRGRAAGGPAANAVPARSGAGRL